MMKRRLLPIGFALALALAACHTQSRKPDTIASHGPSQDTTDVKDSLVDSHVKAIKKHYAQSRQNDGKIALELKGKRAYEDDSVVALSFDEIQQFGSWHYSTSALVFLKENNQLVAVTASPDHSVNGLRLVSGIAFPNKIDGNFKEMKDLTGDGIPEFLFLDYRNYHDEVEEKLNVYRLNKKSRLLEQLNLTAFSHGKAAGDTLEGTNETLEVLQKSGIVAVKSEEMVRNDKGKLAPAKSHTAYYKYDVKKGFVKTDFP